MYFKKSLKKQNLDILLKKESIAPKQQVWVIQLVIFFFSFMKTRSICRSRVRGTIDLIRTINLITHWTIQVSGVLTLKSICHGRELNDKQRERLAQFCKKSRRNGLQPELSVSDSAFLVWKSASKTARLVLMPCRFYIIYSCQQLHYNRLIYHRKLMIWFW